MVLLNQESLYFRYIVWSIGLVLIFSALWAHLYAKIAQPYPLKRDIITKPGSNKKYVFMRSKLDYVRGSSKIEKHFKAFEISCNVRFKAVGKTSVLTELPSIVLIDKSFNRLEVDETFLYSILNKVKSYQSTKIKQFLKTLKEEFYEQQ